MAKISRRSLILGTSASSILLLTLNTQASNRFLAVRIWPAQAYTRITLESDAKVRFKYFMLTQPNRLVVDVDNTALNTVLSDVGQKIQRDDPYVANIRAAQKDNKTVRIVFDLKTAIKPQIFNLDPVANFKHRLTIDLYPTDPIQDFLASRKPKNTATKTNKKTTAANRRPVIMLDPGHGGEDSGAISPNGLQEKTVVLAIANETKKRLEELGYVVKMTRHEDVFIKLHDRVQLAQKANVDVFVSIHANSAGSNTQAHGAEVYALTKTGAKTEAARLLEEKENNADVIGGVQMSDNKNVNNVLLDMVQNQTLNDSNRLARLVLNQIGKNITLRNKSVDHANFVVLRSPEIPSILVETAFVTNAQDENLLKSNDFRRKIGRAIAEGIKQYLGAAVLARH